MNVNRFLRLGGLVFVVMIGLVGLYVAQPTTAQEPTDPPLHYKAALGLMPPAYEQGEGGIAVQSTAPLFPYLQPYTTTALGSWPQVVASGDFNSDGRNDVVGATAFYFDEANDEQLLAYSRTAGDPLTEQQRLPAGSDPEAMLRTDLNLDGRDDVVMALAGGEQLAFYTQTISPTSALTGPVLIDLGAAPNALAAGDFDGDLWDDLAAITPFDEMVRLWANSAVGQDFLLDLPYETGGFDDLAVGDLDNDGDDDLAALRGAGFTTDSVIIFVQDEGAFSESYTLSPETGGYLPHSIAVGDVTGDGLDDLVVTAGGNSPKAYLNVFVQDSYGYGLLLPPQVYEAYHLPGAVTIGDVDHDGLNDVVLVNEGWRTLSIYTQNDDHTLADYTIADLPYASRYRPDALTLSDLDGNGSLDVGVVGFYHDLAVLYNTLTAPVAVIETPMMAEVVISDPLRVSGTVSADAVAVEVRLKGYGDWQAATLNGPNWELDLDMPDLNRPWWVEARAVNAAGHYQSLPDRHRIRFAGLTCQLYAVHDKGSSKSQLFTVNFTTLEGGVNVYGPPYPNADIEALEIDPINRQLYTVKSYEGSKTSELFRLDPLTSELVLVGPIQTETWQGFKEVDALAFRPDGTLWGFAKAGPSSRRGIIQIDPATGTATLEVLCPFQAESLAWSPDGTKLWAGAGKDLYSYTDGGPITHEFDVDDLPSGRIEGLEFRPDGLLLAGMHHSSQFNIYAIDVSGDEAELVLTSSFDTDKFNDVEGLAWPDWCSVDHLPQPHQVEPDEDTLLSFLGDDERDVEITLPNGAVTEETTLSFTALNMSLGGPPNFVFAANAFRLDAFRDGQLLPDFTFDQPISVTLTYLDEDVAGLDEASLTLHHWDPDQRQWVDTACGGYVRKVDKNRITVPICHLTEFATFASLEAETVPDPDPEIDTTDIQIYLPTVIKD